MKKYSSPHLGYFDVVEACQEPGCPVCRLSSREVKKYLDAILYDCVTDPDIRDELRRTLGYCHMHAWQLSTVGRGYLLGVSIIYEDVLDIVQSELSRFRPQKSNGNPLKRLFSNKKGGSSAEENLPRPRCPACIVTDNVEMQALKVLCKALHDKDEAMNRALASSEGLCLQHLRQAFAYISDAAVGDILVAVTRERITDIRAGLKEFIRKNDHRFQHEPIGSERDSWKHALSFLVGAKDDDEK
jgi:hypothetical protein